MKLSGVNKVSDFVWEIPAGAKHGMKVPARIYADEKLLQGMDDAVFDQITNVAFLPGILDYALCMPDGHSGYGFPIGGVAAMDPDRGVISPGGIGFDINCGIRMMTTSLALEEVRPRLKPLVDAIFKSVPSGVGSGGVTTLTGGRLDEAMVKGSRCALENGYATAEDIENTEENGAVAGADPGSVSGKARERGRNQLGSLGSGNHFLEIQVARRENVYDENLAREFGVTGENQVVLMIHCGSRGFGHQVATDYLQRFLNVMTGKYGLSMPDRELACAPFRSDDGQRYFEAMNCAINIAFLNRQLIMHRVREVFSDFFGKSPAELGMRLIYDVSHNTAKLEPFTVDGRERQLLIHRKGATRAYCAGMKGIPERYRGTGQPVIIGGSMESGSYLMVGLPGAKDTFYSTVHGSGRLLSRHQAKRQFRGRELQKNMEDRGIYVQTSSFPGLAEEAGGAYKDIDAVVSATYGAQLSKPVAKLVPIGNIKG
jgi:tRNA-splicing ligase RtcB